MTRSLSAAKIDFAKLTNECAAAMQPEALTRLAAALGVSIESLVRLGMGWSARHRAWSVPMQDAAGNVLGKYASAHDLRRSFGRPGTGQRPGRGEAQHL